MQSQLRFEQTTRFDDFESVLNYHPEFNNIFLSDCDKAFQTMSRFPCSDPFNPVRALRIATQLLEQIIPSFIVYKIHA